MMCKLLSKIFIFVYVFFSMIFLNVVNAAIEKGEIIFFISFSMPDQSIKSILEDAAKIKSTVVLRGLIDHSFTKTINKIYTITQNNQVSLQIDPELFKKYDISKVPAVLIRKKTNQREKYEVIYGDVALENILDHLAQRKSEISSIAEEKLRILRGFHG